MDSAEFYYKGFEVVGNIHYYTFSVLISGVCFDGSFTFDLTIFGTKVGSAKISGFAVKELPYVLDLILETDLRIDFDNNSITHIDIDLDNKILEIEIAKTENNNLGYFYYESNVENKKTD